MSTLLSPNNLLADSDDEIGDDPVTGADSKQTDATKEDVSTSIRGRRVIVHKTRQPTSSSSSSSLLLAPPPIAAPAAHEDNSSVYIPLLMSLTAKVEELAKSMQKLQDKQQNIQEEVERKPVLPRRPLYNIALGKSNSAAELIIPHQYNKERMGRVSQRRRRRQQQQQQQQQQQKHNPIGDSDQINWEELTPSSSTTTTTTTTTVSDIDDSADPTFVPSGGETDEDDNPYRTGLQVDPNTQSIHELEYQSKSFQPNHVARPVGSRRGEPLGGPSLPNNAGVRCFICAKRCVLRLDLMPTNICGNCRAHDLGRLTRCVRCGLFQNKFRMAIHKPRSTCHACQIRVLRRRKVSFGEHKGKSIAAMIKGQRLYCQRVLNRDKELFSPLSGRDKINFERFRDTLYDLSSLEKAWERIMNDDLIGVPR